MKSFVLFFIKIKAYYLPLFSAALCSFIVLQKIYKETFSTEFEIRKHKQVWERGKRQGGAGYIRHQRDKDNWSYVVTVVGKRGYVCQKLIRQRHQSLDCVVTSSHLQHTPATWSSVQRAPRLAQPGVWSRDWTTTWSGSLSTFTTSLWQYRLSPQETKYYF